MTDTTNEMLMREISQLRQELGVVQGMLAGIQAVVLSLQSYHLPYGQVTYPQYPPYQPEPTPPLTWAISDTDAPHMSAGG